MRAACIWAPMLLFPGAAFGQQATWTVDPAEAAIGEPTRWRLEVQHDGADTVIGGPETFESAGTHILVTGGPHLATVPAAPIDGQERATTSLVWTVIGTEPGEALGPEISIELESGLDLEWAAGSGLVVTGELGPDEDQPRDLPAAPGWDGLGSDGRPWGLWAALGFAGLFCAAGIWFVRKKSPQGSTAEPARVAPRVRLQALLDGGGEGPAGGSQGDERGVGFGVSSALRDAVEARTGKAEPGHPAAEWLLDQDAAGLSLSAEGRAELESLLLRADDMKFGPLEGRLGQLDLLKRALGLLDEIETSTVLRTDSQEVRP